jgi:deazaflavin-dependent oxidoreductase (nitroreductase family)
MSADDVCYLTTTGRRSGRPHRIEIWFLEHRDSVYLFSGGGEGSDWVRNLKRDSHVQLELPGRAPQPYSATLLDDAASSLRREMDAKYHATPPGEALTEWAQHSTVVRLTPRV